MTFEQDFEAQGQRLVDEFRGRDTDVLIYCGGMERGVDTEVIRKCISRKVGGCKARTVLMLLVTGGGDPDVAFRIARCLQAKYEKFTLYVSGPCKSAGTLVATGAHELVFSDFGELGPLDVQFSKKDHLWGLQSGFVTQHAIESLTENTFALFEKVFLRTIMKSEGRITVETAGKYAADLAAGVMTPVFSQIDPMYIGEVERANMMGSQYGTRLIDGGKNLDRDGLTQLIAGYPSHSFVIDRAEAEQIFRKVSEPDDLEISLAELLDKKSRQYDAETLGPFFLDEIFKSTSPTIQESQDDRQTATHKGSDDPGPGGEAPGDEGEVRVLQTAGTRDAQRE